MFSNEELTLMSEALYETEQHTRKWFGPESGYFVYPPDARAKIDCLLSLRKKVNETLQSQKKAPHGSK